MSEPIRGRVLIPCVKCDELWPADMMSDGQVCPTCVNKEWRHWALLNRLTNTALSVVLVVGMVAVAGMYVLITATLLVWLVRVLL